MDPNSPEAQARAMHMFAMMVPFMMIFWVVIMAILIIPLWQICKKAGLSAPLSLLALIPGIGVLVVLYVVAFSQWKIASPVAAYPPSYPPSAYPPQSTSL